MYKFLNQKGKSIISERGNTKWTMGEWQHVDGKIVLCENGLHASKTIYQAFSYVQGSVLAEVEAKGKKATDKDKVAYSDMRVVKAYKWTKKDSVALAIFSAELCIKEYEKLYPNDKRPREAIEAARAVLLHDTAKNRSAAESAARSAAESAAWSAWSAARSAAWSAESAAWSAWAAWSAARYARSAAESAWSAWSAESAAWYARSAAESAAWSAWSAALKKIDKWFNNRVKELEEIK